MATSSPPTTLPRILYIDHTAKLGGGEIALLHLVQHLDRARFVPVVVLGEDGPLRAKLEESGVETHILALSSDVTETRKDGLGLSTLLRLRDVGAAGKYVLTLRKFIRAQNAAVVHTNSLKSDILGGLAARLAGVPLLWHVRDRIDSDYLPGPVAAVFRRLCRFLPARVVANSHSTLETITLGATLPRMCVVHDGVLPHPAPLPSAPIFSDPHAPTIGLVGRIARWKGQHVFLNAASLVHTQFPEAKFQIIGAPLFAEQAYEEEIQEQTRTLGLAGCVEFLGFRTDVPALIDRLDILAHASISAEPFGLVIAEGMAAGKPVVATNGGGAREIVADGETGLLVPMGDAEAMASALLQLLEDPEQARRMGERGRERVAAQFSIERTARGMEAVYDGMLWLAKKSQSEGLKTPR